MLISLITAIAVGGITYAAERAVDRTIAQGRAIKQSGGSIRQTIENTTAGMVSAVVQTPQPTPSPVVYDADEFDDDLFAEELPPEEVEVIEESDQEPAPELPRDSTGKFTKKKK